MANFAALLTAVLAAVSPALALWPLPKSIESGTAALTLSSSFAINLDVSGASEDLLDAVKRTEDQIKNDKLERLVVGRGAADVQALGGAKGLGALTVSLAQGAAVSSISDEAVKPLAERDETYQLVVPDNGDAATLTAKTSLGLLRGLTTFSQLWYTHSDQIYTIEAPFKIDDAPAYVRALAPRRDFPYQRISSPTAGTCSIPLGISFRCLTSNGSSTPCPPSKFVVPHSPS